MSKKEKEPLIIDKANSKFIRIDRKAMKRRSSSVNKPNQPMDDVGMVQHGGLFYDHRQREKWSFTILNFPRLAVEYLECDKGLGVESVDQKEVSDLVSQAHIPTLIRRVSTSGCTLGADPEVFVINRRGTIIPAFKFLPAKSSGNPYWDGFQAEFTTPGLTSEHSSHPRCLVYFTDEIRDGLDMVLRKAMEKYKYARLTWRSVLDVPQRILDEAKVEHLELGCAPSRNAYPHIEPLDVPDPAALPIRFAGCHIHLGLQEYMQYATGVTPEHIVKTIDAIFGTMSVLLLRGMEDPRRRLYYGRAGEFRLPKWGIEYRTPSSTIMAHPVIWHLCLDVLRAAAFLGLLGVNIWKADETTVANVINSYNVGGATEIIKENEPVMKAILNRRYGPDRAYKALQLIYKGALDVIGEDRLSRMEENWLLVSQGHGRYMNGGNTCVAAWVPPNGFAVRPRKARRKKAKEATTEPGGIVTQPDDPAMGTGNGSS